MVGIFIPTRFQRVRFVNLNIDLNVHGVGGVDIWGPAHSASIYD